MDNPRTAISRIYDRLKKRQESKPLVVILTNQAGKWRHDASFCAHVPESQKAFELQEANSDRVVGVFNCNVEEVDLFEACEAAFNLACKGQVFNYSRAETNS